MAIARTGNIVGAISGNLGGVVFANTNQGLLVKHRPLKTNKRTTDQLRQRAQMQQLITLWKTLTAAEYLEWRVLAEQITTTNRLGVHSNLSPFRLFTFQNLMRLLVGAPTHTSPYPIGPAQPCRVDSATFTAGGTYSITLDITEGWNSGTCLLYGYRPFRNFPTRGIRSWKWLGYRFFVNDTPEDIASLWDPVLGAPAAGEFVHVKIALHPTFMATPHPPHIFTTTFV